MDRVRKKKIVWSVVGGILAVILIAVAGVAIWFFTLKSVAAGLDNAPLDVEMFDQYYVGTEGTVDLSLMFPEAKNFSGPNVVNGKLTVSGTAPFEIKVDNKTKKVTVINGGYNLSDYADIVEAVKDEKIVVVQTTELAMTKEDGTLSLKNHFYGNGVKIDAYELVKSSSDGKKDWGKGGDDAFKIDSPDKEIIMRDTQVIGKILEEDENNLKIFNNYGSLLYVSTEVKGKNKSLARIEHCIFEGSHKVVHIMNSNITIEGTIVRNASDTAISIGTFPNRGSTINIKNSVVASSLTGGILMYCYDNGTYNAESWNTLNIEGFLDIYNWKKTSELAFLPDTEGEQLASLANQIASGEIKPVNKYTDMKVTIGSEQYVHFGIIKISTGPGKNQSTINGFENLGYTTEDFPLPTLAKGIMKDLKVYGYYGNNKGAVSADAKLGANLDKLYSELVNGRK